MILIYNKNNGEIEGYSLKDMKLNELYPNNDYILNNYDIKIVNDNFKIDNKDTYKIDNGKIIKKQAEKDVTSEQLFKSEKSDIYYAIKEIQDYLSLNDINFKPRYILD